MHRARVLHRPTGTRHDHGSLFFARAAILSLTRSTAPNPDLVRPVVSPVVRPVVRHWRRPAAAMPKIRAMA